MSELMDALSKISDAIDNGGSLKVGFLSDAKYTDNTQVAEIAVRNNYGSPKANIPARPFFSDMVSKNEPEWGEKLGSVLKANDYNVEISLNAMGEGIKGQLQDAINDFDSVPLAQSTIDAKGFDKQLIETHTMINAVDYEVS